MQEETLYLIGYASGIAGVNAKTGEGPLVIQRSPYLEALTDVAIHWNSMIYPPVNATLRLDEKVKQSCEDLARSVSACVQNKQFFTVIGGDHTCAIGTWSGGYDALHASGEMGLIWIDAHMDSHTPETSPSGRIHGMPLAALLGYGYSTLTSVLHYPPKLKPENICLIGVRSFESGEAELLKRLNVRIYFMEEVKQRGLITVLKEAVEHVSHHTVGYGMTLDLDSIDPKEAFGVDVPEPDGIHTHNLYKGLSSILSDPKLIGVEIAEFDPMKDKNAETEKLIVSLLRIIANSRRNT